MINKYVVASSKNWFTKTSKSNQYNKLKIINITDQKDLSISKLRKIDPKFIFFPHWNWKINSEIYNNFECIGFHTSPLPYGRGGSPIQNMIIRNFKESPVCAFRITEILDGGPIYDLKKISLEGKISEIFLRIAKSIEQMIIKICINNPKPVEQKGQVVSFKRLKNSDNKLLNTFSLKEIYNRIRMVDGEDYQKAYLLFGSYKIEFSESSLVKGELHARVKLFKNDD